MLGNVDTTKGQAVGAWGPGLYSDDFAADLRTTVSTVCRLPLSAEEILATLERVEPEASMPHDDEYTTFWLVVADQLHRRGIASEATARAIAIIDDRSNFKVLAELDMSETDLRKRESMLRTLRATLVAPLPVRPRRMLRKPEPLLVSPGEVFTFPIDRFGNVRNPYFPDGADAGFQPAGWGCCLIVGAAHALGYLAWYGIAANVELELERPGLARAVAKLKRSTYGLGTLTRTRMRRMGLERIGTIEPPLVDPPKQEHIMLTVTADICASNIFARWNR